jgi:hypothetical protein
LKQGKVPIYEMVDKIEAATGGDPRGKTAPLSLNQKIITAGNANAES